MDITPNNIDKQLNYYKEMYLNEKKKNEILYKDNEKIMNEINIIEQNNQILRNQIENNSRPRLTFGEALESKLTNSILGNANNYESVPNSHIMGEHPNGFCNRKFSWNCCFARDTKLIVKENGKIIKKNIQDIEKDDNALTLINGEKIFTKVKYKRNYDDEYKFYEFKCVKEDKMKIIRVTHNHIMIVYDKEMKNIIYKTAENIIKNKDYFNSIDGLYEVKEIKIYNMKYKYALGVDEGSILADDILVSCLNMNDYNKNLSLNEIIKKYNIIIKN